MDGYDISSPHNHLMAYFLKNDDLLIPFTIKRSNLVMTVDVWRGFCRMKSLSWNHQHFLTLLWVFKLTKYHRFRIEIIKTLFNSTQIWWPHSFSGGEWSFYSFILSCQNDFAQWNEFLVAFCSHSHFNGHFITEELSHDDWTLSL